MAAIEPTLQDAQNFGVHLAAGLEDNYLTEAQYIKFLELTDAEVKAVDDLPETTEDEKAYKEQEQARLPYRLAKLKAQASENTYVTDDQIDDLFATCSVADILTPTEPSTPETSEPEEGDNTENNG